MMRVFVPVVKLVVALALLLCAPSASGQTIETVGSRALGMGGAFVAVASDSSATWWNPAALAAGPFFDSSIGRAFDTPSSRQSAQATWFALGTPPLGLSNYRLQLAGPALPDPTATGGGSREEEGGGVSARQWQVSQWGVTLVQTLLPGIHVGTTLKYLRGTVRTGVVGAGLSDAAFVDAAEVLSGGDGEGHFDLDVGLLGVVGPVRIGMLARNLREADFGPQGPRVPRQVRLGAALDIAAVGGPALMVSVDADTKTYASTTGDRRVLAAGVEQWLAGRRVGLRAGIRQNRAGARELVFTAGGSVRVGETWHLDGFIVRGRDTDERGWGLATRVSY